MSRIGVFVTATGTGVGKTVISAALARHWSGMGRRVAALKPVETGCDPEPADARTLAEACGAPSLAEVAGFYRARAPLAPWAATLAGEAPPPAPARLADAVRAAAEGADVWIVEGAGGVLVPLDATHDLIDLAVRLGFGALLVAHDGLGVLSYTLTAAEALARRSVPLLAVALVRHNPEEEEEDPSLRSNAAILSTRLAPVPVLSVPPLRDDGFSLAVQRLAEVIEARRGA